MRWNWQALVAAIALTAAVRAATAPAAAPKRPDLATAKPIVACKLQSLAAKLPPASEPNAVMMYGRPQADDSLANYQRTALGDWPMLAVAERTDPWLRVVLLSRKRPVVIDLAVLIDGKSFRDKRESWSDELVTAAKQGVKQPAAKDVAKEAAADSGEKGNNKSAPPGTKSALSASEASKPKSNSLNTQAEKVKGTTEADKDKADKSVNDKADTADDDKADKDKAEKSKPEVVPGISAQIRQIPTMRERLADYLATNPQVEREEVHWLLAAWGAGPDVVLLDPSLSWQRSERAVMEDYLDRNGDGGLSRKEIAEAEAMLRRADVDANDVVDVSEIRRVMTQAAFAPKTSGYPLIVMLDANTDWQSLETTMVKIYGKDSVEAEARGLQSREADITLQVNLSTADKSPTGVSVVSTGSDVSKSTSAVTATADVVTLDLGGDYVEFSAAQSAAAQESDSATSQIAIGAVLDGNPLLRLLDRDNDGRLTRRERQEMTGLFASLDRNSDGEASNSEVPMPIRFAVTLGPHVHSLLASPTAAARATTTRTKSPEAPTWFTSMDKNRDGDLSRGEFLGTTEQFKQLDANSDGLLSVAEALKLKADK